MKNSEPIKLLLERLWGHIDKRRQIQFGLLLILVILVSFAEVLSIGAILPFLAILTAPQRVFNNPKLQPVLELVGILSVDQLLIFLTIVFCVASLVAGAMRLLFLWASTKLAFSVGTDLSIKMYRRTLYQPYILHLQRNSSEVIDGVTHKITTVTQIILMAIHLVGNTVLLSSILIVMLYIDPLIAITGFFGFGTIYGLIIGATKNKVLRDGELIAHESTKVIKVIQEGLGGIRDVLIDGTQNLYCDTYSVADNKLRRAQGRSQFISHSPRYAMEALGMVLIASLAYFLTRQSDNVSDAIPVLGALALAAQRLLPLLQQAYSSWSTIQASRSSLVSVLEFLDQPLPDYASQPAGEKINFQDRISLRNVSFKYSHEAPWVLKDINLEITKGSRVGFIGSTGSGKSTLIDLIMGLLPPSDGDLKIDGQSIADGKNCRAWQSQIAHVPQVIFLSDSTIEENIAFGIPPKLIDMRRVKEAAMQAQLANVIESWPDQYQTLIGERGVRLSGGQRQRIGIARALYKQVDVIIFDEATSALDNETEEAVMQAIENLSKQLTILIIAHRLTTLKNCTQIVELSESKIKNIGTYENLMSKLDINSNALQNRI